MFLAELMLGTPYPQYEQWLAFAWILTACGSAASVKLVWLEGILDSSFVNLFEGICLSWLVLGVFLHAPPQYIHLSSSGIDSSSGGKTNFLLLTSYWDMGRLLCEGTSLSSMKTFGICWATVWKFSSDSCSSGTIGFEDDLQVQRASYSDCWTVLVCSPS